MIPYAVPLLLLFLLGQAGPEPAEREPKRVYLRAERFSFTPSRIKLQKGQPLELTIVSEDTQHGFWIRKLGINYLIPARGKGRTEVEDPVARARPVCHRMLACLRRRAQHDAGRDHGQVKRKGKGRKAWAASSKHQQVAPCGTTAR